jgi:hypothetical protein
MCASCMWPLRSPQDGLAPACCARTHACRTRTQTTDRLQRPSSRTSLKHTRCVQSQPTCMYIIVITHACMHGTPCWRRVLHRQQGTLAGKAPAVPCQLFWRCRGHLQLLPTSTRTQCVVTSTRTQCVDKVVFMQGTKQIILVRFVQRCSMCVCTNVLHCRPRCCRTLRSARCMMRTARRASRGACQGPRAAQAAPNTSTLGVQTMCSGR